MGDGSGTFDIFLLHTSRKGGTPFRRIPLPDCSVSRSLRETSALALEVSPLPGCTEAGLGSGELIVGPGHHFGRPPILEWSYSGEMQSGSRRSQRLAKDP